RRPVPTTSPTTTLPPTTTTVVTSPEQIAVPTSAADTAAALARVERALRTDDGDLAARRRLGWEQQRAYGALGSHPEWVDAVLAAVPADLRPAVSATVDAAKRLTSPDLGPPLTTLPDWTILTPPEPAVLLGYYREGETRFGVPWQYLAA